MTLRYDICLHFLRGRMPAHASTYCHFFPEVRIILFTSGDKRKERGLVFIQLQFCDFDKTKRRLGFRKRNATAGRFPACPQSAPLQRIWLLKGVLARVSLRLLFFLSFLQFTASLDFSHTRHEETLDRTFPAGGAALSMYTLFWASGKPDGELLPISARLGLLHPFF